MARRVTHNSQQYNRKEEEERVGEENGKRSKMSTANKNESKRLLSVSTEQNECTLFHNKSVSDCNERNTTVDDFCGDTAKTSNQCMPVQDKHVGKEEIAFLNSRKSPSVVPPTPTQSSCKVQSPSQLDSRTTNSEIPTQTLSSIPSSPRSNEMEILKILMQQEERSLHICLSILGVLSKSSYGVENETETEERGG
eukprot:4313582-Ditylum_brightwellii.AAC.1